MKFLLLLSLGMLGILLLAGAVDLGLDAEQKIHYLRARSDMSAFHVTDSGSSALLVQASPIVKESLPVNPPYVPPPMDHPPLKIVAGAYTYSVRYTTQEYLDLNHCGGYTNFNTREIWLATSYGKFRIPLRAVVMHELMHVAMEVATGEQNLIYSGPNVGVNRNHDYIEPAAPALLEIMQENPKLVAWLGENH